MRYQSLKVASLLDQANEPPRHGQLNLLKKPLGAQEVAVLHDRSKQTKTAVMEGRIFSGFHTSIST